MKTYQSILPAATAKRVNCKRRSAIERIGDRIKAKLHEVFSNGFWYCKDHQGVCERVESDQRQPASCDRCGGVHLEWNAPLWTNQIPDSKMIQPQDLR